MKTLYSPSAGRPIEVVDGDFSEKFRSSAQPAARIRRAERAFALLALKDLAAACEATNNKAIFVWAWINYRARYTKSASVKVTNDALKVYGISRHTKDRAISALERAGLITAARRGKQAIVVTLVARPM